MIHVCIFSLWYVITEKTRQLTGDNLITTSPLDNYWIQNNLCNVSFVSKIN